MLKEDSLVWRKSAPFDTSKVLGEYWVRLISHFHGNGKGAVLVLPPQKRDFLVRCNDLSSGWSCRRKYQLPTLCQGGLASQAPPVDDNQGGADGSGVGHDNGDDGVSHDNGNDGAGHYNGDDDDRTGAGEVQPVPLLS